MWLGEKITDKGLGNGTSIIIMIGILGTSSTSIYAGMVHAKQQEVVVVC